jgi:hypothetical protein
MFETTHTKNIRDGNDTATSFPFTFAVNSASDVKVKLVDALGVEGEPLQSSQYGVAVNSDCIGGSVTYPLSGEPLLLGEKIVIYRKTPLTQDKKFTPGNSYEAVVIGKVLDKVTMQNQETKEEVARCVKTSISSTETPEQLLSSIYTARDDAASSASLSAQEAQNAENARLGAQGYQVAASNAKADAETARDEAQTIKDSIATETTTSIADIQAQEETSKANVTTTGATIVAQAETARDEAQAAAASVEMPVSPNEGDFLRRGADGWEGKTIAEVTTAVASEGNFAKADLSNVDDNSIALTKLKTVADNANKLIGYDENGIPSPLNLPSGGGAWSVKESNSHSGSTLNITGITKTIKIILSNIKKTSDSGPLTLCVRTSSNNGISYDSGSSDYAYQFRLSQGNNISGVDPQYNVGTNHIPLEVNPTANSGDTADVVIQINNPQTTKGYKNILFEASSYTSPIEIINGHGIRLSTSIINAISVYNTAYNNASFSCDYIVLELN